MTAPDLSADRAHREAIAYGKLLAVRDILDRLAAQRPSSGYAGDDELRGYDTAVAVVKATRLGVDNDNEEQR